MNYKQLSELDMVQMRQFWFIKYFQINSSKTKGKRINSIYVRFILSTNFLSLPLSLSYYKPIYYLSFVEKSFNFHKFFSLYSFFFGHLDR